jgi:hypothetical protein
VDSAVTSVARLEEAQTVEQASDHPLRPVVWWAAIGALSLAVGVFATVSWVLSSDFKTTGTGSTPVPDFMRWTAIALQAIGPVVMAIVVYRVIIRPWCRDGQLSLNGAFAVACMALYWQEPLANYAGPIFAYNSVYFNWGSWTSKIPGWISANAHLNPQTPLFGGIWYAGYGLLGGVLLGAHVMKRAKRRWPHWTRRRLFFTCFLVLALVDLVMEVIMVRLGIYVYTSPAPRLALFAGHYYQFPIYEPVLWGLTWSGMASVRYFTDDRGRTIVERGMAEVQVGSRCKGVLRVLALTGILTVLLSAYNLCWMWLGQHQHPWPEDIVQRSYFTNGVCGGGSDAACPGGVVPVHMRGTAHLGAENELVVPQGKVLGSPLPHERK